MDKLIDIFNGFINSTGIAMFYQDGGWNNLIMIIGYNFLVYLVLNFCF